jgi:hypothetical protein
VKRVAVGLVLAVAAQAASAQFFAPWNRPPAVTIVANGDDPRIALVEEALAFWNRTLEELGSGFRLGPVTRVDRAIPESALQWMSSSIVGSGGRRAEIPQELRELPGELTVFLAQSGFVSFAGPFCRTSRATSWRTRWDTPSAWDTTPSRPY